MAAFHYNIEILPLDDSQLFAQVLAERRSDQPETTVWAQQPSDESLARLRSIFPINNSWGPCEELVSSDKTWSSDLRIWHHDGRRDCVRKIVCRISAIGFSIELASRILEVVRGHGWFVGGVESQRVYKPEVHALLEDFRLSHAARFVENPGEVLVIAAKDIAANRMRGV